MSIDEYRAINSAGRAILKASHYLHPFEAPVEDYPLQLSTGRKVHHWHARTKTGRSKPLEDACPEPKIQISGADAARFNDLHTQH